VCKSHATASGVCFPAFYASVVAAFLLDWSSIGQDGFRTTSAPPMARLCYGAHDPFEIARASHAIGAADSMYHTDTDWRRMDNNRKIASSPFQRPNCIRKMNREKEFLYSQ
jgi:hypothetical protein